MIAVNNKVSSSGELQVIVKNPKGEIVSDTGWKRNLLSYVALAARLGVPTINNAEDVRLYESATLGTPVLNKTLLIGTFDQSGNTVTSLGATDFSDSTKFKVGDNLKFSSGKRALIQSINSSTEITVFENQTVVGETAHHYLTGHTFSHATQKGEILHYTNTNLLDDNYSEVFNTSGVVERFIEGTTPQLTSTFSFDTVYLQDKARIPLDTPVNIVPGNSVTLRYRTRMTISTPTQQYITQSPITGWPFQTQITNIAADGSKFVVDTDGDHELEVGDSILIQNSIPEPLIASTISSNGSIWTLTVAGHPFNIGDNVVIQSNSGNYNGTYTVATVPDANTITITSAATHAGDAGTVRFETPASYFNGVHTIAAVPTTDSLEVTSALVASTPDSKEGQVGVENANYQLNLFGTGWFYGIRTNCSQNLFYKQNTPQLTAPFPIYNETAPTTGFTALPKTNTLSSLNAANGYTQSVTIASTTAEANHFPRIKQLLFDLCFDSKALLTFDHVQNKPNTHDMTVTVGTRYTQDLP